MSALNITWCANCNAELEPVHDRENSAWTEIAKDDECTEYIGKCSKCGAHMRIWIYHDMGGADGKEKKQCGSTANNNDKRQCEIFGSDRPGGDK